MRGSSRLFDFVNVIMKLKCFDRFQWLFDIHLFGRLIELVAFLIQYLIKSDIYTFVIYNIVKQYKIMGVCPSLNPETRALKNQNQKIITFILNEIKDFKMYNFYKHLNKNIKNFPQRYLLNQGIIQDIHKLHFYANKSLMESGDSRITEFISERVLDDQLKSSCLILQNQVISESDFHSTEYDRQKNQSNPFNFEGSHSFHNNVCKNQSLIAQMHLIYGKQINRDEYSQSLKLFLKWIQYFNEHAYGGFLKPVYRSFCQSLLQIDKSQFESLVDQVGVFVQFMVRVYTEIYNLKVLNESRNGKLFKNQNIYNLIMSFMFKKTKLKSLVRSMIKVNQDSKIKKFEEKLKTLHKKSIFNFGIDKKFILIGSQHKSLRKKQIKQEQNTSTQEQKPCQPATNQKVFQSYLSFKSKTDNECYQQSLKLVSELSLSCDVHTPVSKLKILITISKKIIEEIEQFYKKYDQEAPEIDPDNLSSIVMYLIAKNNNSNIYEELKIIEYFTTTNALNSISGYYLNLFLADCDMIIAEGK